jgi:ubiquinone biosynthesis accessory factor UbiK
LASRNAAYARRGALSKSGVDAMLNLNRQSIDDLLARVGEAVRTSPAQDVERNVKALLSSGLARLDLVSRADFDVQAQVLARTRAKIEALEARVAELEARRAGGAPPAAS